MKSVCYALGVLAVCMVVLSSVTSAQTSSAQLTEKRLRVIETNLVAALESGLPSVQASAATVLKQVKMLAPDYGFSRAVIPLMRIVKDENQLTIARLSAALALSDLRSEMGDFAIKRTGEFTGDQRVKRVCQLLALNRSQEN